eukprot:1842514-Amphidinium_carterae.1
MEISSQAQADLVFAGSSSGFSAFFMVVKKLSMTSKDSVQRHGMIPLLASPSYPLHGLPVFLECYLFQLWGLWLPKGWFFKAMNYKKQHLDMSTTDRLIAHRQSTNLTSCHLRCEDRELQGEKENQPLGIAQTRIPHLHVTGLRVEKVAVIDNDDEVDLELSDASHEVRQGSLNVCLPCARGVVVKKAALLRGAQCFKHQLDCLHLVWVGLESRLVAPVAREQKFRTCFGSDPSSK